VAHRLLVGGVDIAGVNHALWRCGGAQLAEQFVLLFLGEILAPPASTLGLGERRVAQAARNQIYGLATSRSSELFPSGRLAY
jgi:hypothetical protein